MKLKLLKIARFFHLISKKKYKEKRDIALVASADLFCKKWYLKQYPDIKKSKMNPAKHYYKHGWKEGRNPSKKFDSNAYLRDNYDVASANVCPLVHYLVSGAKEGRIIRDISGRISPKPMSFGERVVYVLAYPKIVKAEYDRVCAEIAELKKRR